MAQAKPLAPCGHPGRYVFRTMIVCEMGDADCLYWQGVRTRRKRAEEHRARAVTVPLAPGKDDPLLRPSICAHATTHIVLGKLFCYDCGTDLP